MKKVLTDKQRKFLESNLNAPYFRLYPKVIRGILDSGTYGKIEADILNHLVKTLKRK